MDAGKIDLPIPSSGQCAGMLEDGGNGPTDTRATQVRNDAKRAKVVTAVLHFDGGTGKGTDGGSFAACTEAEPFFWLTFEGM